MTHAQSLIIRVCAFLYPPGLFWAKHCVDKPE